MSALDDYADIIAETRDEMPDVRLEEQEAIIALADELDSLQPDAALGALVRRMPEDHGLVHETQWCMIDWEAEEILGAFHDTPEAALGEALESSREKG